MILDDLPQVVRELRKMRIEFIVVGGASLERTYPIGTGDIDVAIALRDYAGVLEKLRAHPRVRNVEDVGTIAGSEFRVGTRWVDVEFINPTPFAGKRRADDFIADVSTLRELTGFSPSITIHEGIRATFRSGAIQ